MINYLIITKTQMSFVQLFHCSSLIKRREINANVSKKIKKSDIQQIFINKVISINTYNKFFVSS